MANQGKYFLTKEGKARVEREFQELSRLKDFKTKGESPRIFHSEDINPEFLSFQEDLELLDARLVELDNILKNVQIIAPPAKDRQGVVDLGARVVLEVDGQSDEFEIVGSLEANPIAGKISNECPVGRSLMHHKVGDEIVVGSNPQIVYRIKAIKYSHN